MEEKARELDQAAANATRRAAREARGAVRQQVRDLIADIEELTLSLRDAAYPYVRERPWQLMGAALAAGFIIGLLLKQGEHADGGDVRFVRP